MAYEGAITQQMALRNFIVEGVSGSGKTSVCNILHGRGFHAIHGDRVLRPDNAPPLAHSTRMDSQKRAAWLHAQGIWDPSKVRAEIANQSRDVSFFCGGFRNHAALIGLFDRVFVLDVDRQTLLQRHSRRPDDEFGGTSAERELILHLHKTKEDMPTEGIIIDATAPIEAVVDDILRRCGLAREG